MARKRELEKPTTEAPKVFCDAPGCENRAFNRVAGRNMCRACLESEHRERAAEACKARGLNSIAEMRAYCMRLAKSFVEPSFERWCKNMRQETVDIIARGGSTTDEKCLERLRAAGVIDGRNKLIPLEARAVAADAHRAERARVICKVEEELRARADLPLGLPNDPLEEEFDRERR